MTEYPLLLLAETGWFITDKGRTRIPDDHMLLMARVVRDGEVETAALLIEPHQTFNDAMSALRSEFDQPKETA